MTRRATWVLSAVPVLFVAIFFVYPVARIVGRGLDIAAFADVAGDSHLRGVVWFTLWQAVVSTVATVAVALPAAHVLARYRFRGRGLVRALVTIPFALPTVVVGAAFLALSRPGAPLARLERSVWLLLLAHVFFNYSVVVRTVASRWANLDRTQEDAARVLGAGPWRTFRAITLPRLAPAILASALIVFLFTFTAFGTVLILGGAGRATVEVEVYRRTAELLDLRTASALVILQVIAIGALVVVSARSAGAARGERVRAARELARRPTGAARVWVAGNVAVAIVLVGSPLGVLLARALDVRGRVGLTWFTTLGVDARGSTLFVPPMAALWNSLLFAASAMTIAVLIGSLAAIVLARHRRSPTTRALEGFLLLPLAVSAVTVGFGFLVAFDRSPFDLRTSALLIPLAHALVGLPFVVRLVAPALRSVDPQVRDAASTLGAPPWRVWRHVDVPLAAPTVAVAAAFAFLVSLGEFGATAFIARPERPTVPIAIFRLLAQPGAANQGAAMALSVVLAAVTAVVTLVIDRFTTTAFRELA